MTELHQEKDLVRGKTVLGVIAGVIVATTLGVLIAWGIGSCRSSEFGQTLEQPPVTIPPEVNAMETTLFAEEAAGLKERAEAQERLKSYGWVNRERGVVHIPIDAAFELYLGRREGGAR